MAADPATHNIVAFGGGSAFFPKTLEDRTWTWDGTNWTLRHPAHHPTARALAATTFDPSAHNVVLFSGLDGPLPAISHQTWTWNGTDWNLQQPAQHPSGRFAYMTTDPATCAVVLFGGENTSFTPLGDTWVYASARHHGDETLWHGACHDRR